MENKIKYTIITYKAAIVIILCAFCFKINAQIPLPLKRFIETPSLKGASVSFMVKEVKSGNILYAYDPERELIPASVMKTVTTAVALELLGANFQFATSVQYDGKIENGVLNGNIYIQGSGDPTINSSKLKTKKDSIFNVWALAIKQAGIQKINGSIIADESIFDTEGVSMKWMREDLGSDYGQGSYGINIFDNQYTVYLETGEAGTKPTILYTEPSMRFITFHNYMQTLPVSKDSFYITGFPYADDRYLYGSLRASQTSAKITGDIPEPALYAAQYFANYLFVYHDIQVEKEASCYRILSQSDQWNKTERKKIITTYSPALKEIIRITNFKSHNLYADALLKTLGLQYQSEIKENISSFEKGIRIIKKHLEKNKINVSSLWMYDGSGLASTNKATSEFLCDLYIHMSNSPVAETYLKSLPLAGIEGTVRNFLKGTSLQGKMHLKSGSMSRVTAYGGYIQKDGKNYAVALLINNFPGKITQMKSKIEELFLSLF
ncbi:MAG: D-alanyl-D-alanine carboxypeptidase/D-alanyl-D-alanine-endopeptidase [Tannerella sp.]|jgi:D-alanyl-D-alanine carboxypeptidase/D-alanyl-D-alanine-endopeptidase (penicillin-binding protein 4)|nr:D-alanyl-D-alanine carboxypeptidase/D-alanyl-D-alanine-endopeptidase [Tannerella sp.]